MNYYIYAHYTLDTNELFYIGKGNGNRAYTSSKGIKGRNNYWHKIVNKHGYKVKILIDGLKEPDAFIQEILAIKEFSPRANFTKGGDGCSGYKHTDVTKEKMRNAKLGTKQSRESIEKRMRRGSDHWGFGKQRRESTKDKISKTKKEQGIKTNCIKVYCTLTNKIWNSIKDCADDLGIKRTTLSCKLKGQNKNNTSIRYYQEVSIG